MVVPHAGLGTQGLNALVRQGARSEAIDAKIQWLNYTAHGFRNRDRFRTAIYFHLGGLDLNTESPSAASSSHTSW